MSKRIENPDDYFSAGPLQMARYGKNTVMESNWEKGQFEEFQQKLQDEFPIIIDEIDVLITSIVSLVITLPAEQLLLRARTLVTASCLGKKSEAEYGTDDSIAFRMVDYIQSIIASAKPAASQKKEVSEEDWQQLYGLVEKLFNKLNLEYQICSTAKRREIDPNLDLEVEEFYYKAQMYWCNVRGHRYLVHEEISLRELLSPHSDILDEIYGIKADQLIVEISKIINSMTFGLGEAIIQMDKFRHATLDKLDESFIREHPTLDMPQLMAKVIKDNDWQNWQEKVFGQCLGFDLYDLHKTTNLPSKLLNELCWEVGQDSDFLADGEFSGWPLRIWPIFKRPFIKINSTYYCFDLQSLLDHLYRVLQRAICSQKPEYKPTWNKKQKEVSEQLPFTYFKKLLPTADVYHSVYYKWHTGKQGGKQWCEADGLVIFDGHLFILEIKAGAFTYTSPATDFPAYVKSLQNLILKPALQGSRFVEYLNSQKSVEVFDENHKKISELSANDYSGITICPITLDSFTELASQSQHLKPLDIDVGELPVWAISIDDLRVYADIFINPLIFMHFIKQRMRSFASKIIQTDDELDHVGLYLKHNSYVQHAKNLQGNSEAAISFNGYRTDVDIFFSDKLENPSIESPLKQDMPQLFFEIIELITISAKPQRTKIVSDLLDLSGDWRSSLTEGVKKALTKQISSKQLQPLSTYGESRITVCCWHALYVDHDPKLALDHTKASMLVTQDENRILLELFYDEHGKLHDVDWSYIIIDEKEPDIERLQVLAEKLKTKRLAASGKIGRNQQCPCGSGKKYKQCCRE
ncbi:preprotein translocase subunit SecA [Colwellia sp. MB02u-18]|uniref:SEC-C metal-binding domain-containing protein n=1 Tax=unclassified Colwellia TaxID=196834 RepID=UPI0015F4A83A|nr:MULTISPECIES: SEC-C metal-binding domain-containing protein [unclassified Colwellia]MBA6224825.1 preprotein translocase subunit SecA [Colwellia sp. MB3u-45]MBA6268887.1 preprotein translocase subunit SecA [Colwellia sp. MB3u-43]MBA6321318.1 preprotein translocase subunit SecA [Colwellia sp. MB02u-19]MBA6325871.1 preprotein translocase subunit SecA [Colwellia sp. MB02u-18]MBA6332346.1 preprotein translocase subunit SecA [Colwellia sp. MB02u-12]